MLDTSKFKTQTNLIERKNPSLENYWGIALDIGYSAVKGFSPNCVYSFPSYAKKIVNKTLNLVDTSENQYKDIQYKDRETGEIWAVGENAQDMLTSSDTKDSEATLYNRNRYFSPMFKVVARTGLALGMMSNEFGSPKANLVVQTGLPPAYLKSDTPLLKEVLSGHHDFDIKIGNSQWVNFKFDLPEENVRVMPQPMGTLISIATDNEGNQIPSAASYYKSNLLIFDPGFGTLDIFNINNKSIESYDTFDNLGMRRVLKETCDKIFKEYTTEISVPFMQKYLETGMIRCKDRKNKKTSFEPFNDILEECNKKVCLEALEQVSTIYNDLFDHDYLVITGGTGSGAWGDIIKEYFEGMETLQIVDGGQNDNLPDIFANVRGYYMYLYGMLKRIQK